jgi:hypothetical protein
VLAQAATHSDIYFSVQPVFKLTWYLLKITGSDKDIVQTPNMVTE